MSKKVKKDPVLTKDEAPYATILILVIIFGVVLGLFFALEVYPYRNKFQVGDCVEVDFSQTEFLKKYVYYKIKKIGKEVYLTEYSYTFEGPLRGSKEVWKPFLNEYNKVNPQICDLELERKD